MPYVTKKQMNAKQVAAAHGFRKASELLAERMHKRKQQQRREVEKAMIDAIAGYEGSDDEGQDEDSDEETEEDKAFIANEDDFSLVLRKKNIWPPLNPKGSIAKMVKEEPPSQPLPATQEDWSDLVAGRTTPTLDEFEWPPLGRKPKPRARKIVQSSDEEEDKFMTPPRKNEKPPKKKEVIVISSDEDEDTEDEVTFMGTTQAQLRRTDTLRTLARVATKEVIASSKALTDAETKLEETQQKLIKLQSKQQEFWK